MRHLSKPDLWFFIVLLLVTGGGAVLLMQEGAVRAETRHLSYSRHYWQTAFDAASATCGVGLLTYGFQEDYTPRGRWILTALGVLGAVLFIAAMTQVVRRMQAGGGRSRVPHPLLASGVFLVVQVLAAGIFVLVRRFGESGAGLDDSAWCALAAFSSLGWASNAAAGPAWSLALLAWIGALGWPLWMLMVPPLARRFVPLRATLAMFGGYVLVLLLAAVLVSAFESPRGGVGRGAPDETLSGQPWGARYARSLVQSVAASSAGIPTEPLAASDAAPGTKITLSALLLVGGLGGSATGGVQWPLLLWALAGGVGAIGWLGRSHAAPDFARWMQAGLACVGLLLSLAVIVALGLLLIENWTASRFQPPPSFADAFLDACSVVAGGNLSSGVTEAVTGRNLVSGIRQAANLYQFGIVWLVLAMLAGRMIPLVVLRRLADALHAEETHRRAAVV